MTFGKPGRPPEDRLLRQREIFQAVAQLIVASGARQFTMREAADAACLSIGGLYHYFPTKRDLALHGLHPEARERICADESARMGDLLQQRSGSPIDITIDALMRIYAFIRPSALAVLDLGSDTFQETLDSGSASDLGSLIDIFRQLLPDASDEHLISLARSIRWLVRGALIDRDVDMQQVRSDLRLLIAAHVNGRSRQVA
jgi:AcrR family transcriptional regulator